MGDVQPASARKARTYLAYTALVGAGVIAYMIARAGDPPPDQAEQSDPPQTSQIVDPARRNRLPRNTPVLGVSVGDHHRAYLAEAMTFQRYHVVNDQLGGRPLTVTFCDRSRCAMAFTSDHKDTALDLEKSGYSAADGMLLQIGKHRYTQQTSRPVDTDAPPFPYRTLAVEKTTWGAWVTLHPETELWTGGIQRE